MFSMEIYQLLIKYTKDIEGKDITLGELQYIAWWRCVWGYWKAQAYYKTNGYYERLEDVPEGLMNYVVQTDENNDHYINGRLQRTSKETCRKIYGQ
jgi:hypothetical protein